MMGMGQPTDAMVTIDPALHGVGGSESYETPVSSAKGQVIRLNGQEFKHSRNEVERHRIDAATDLREKELDQTHGLKKMALTTYLEIARAQRLRLRSGMIDFVRLPMA